MVLQIEPKLRRGLKVSGQTQGCVNGNGALAADNGIDSLRRDAQIAAELVLT
jgi:hypothetical protein